jgi:membrane associated rhomboid family serine protease
MILLPIGHEESGTRRLPWITFGVMILCALVFILTGRAGLVAEDDVELGEDVMAALEYYWQHPYLELDPEFEALVFPEGSDGEEFQAAFSEFLDAMPAPEGGEQAIAAEQAVLDNLVAEALGARDGHAFMRWGLVPGDFSLVALITHMFLHAGWLHLLGNMLILYLAGPFIEDVWGRPIYAGFYLVSGIAAALSFVALNPSSEIPMVGASGAIAGVMGAFLVRYRTTQIRFFYMFGFFFRGTFAAPAWVMLPLWFAQQVFMFLLTHGLSGAAGGGVAYMAHIGGFVFGVGAAMGMAHWKVEERHVNPNIEGKVNRTVVDNHAVDAALEAQAAGDPQRAYEVLSAEVRRAPSNRDAALAFWSVAVELNRAAEAAPSLLRSIQHELRSGDPDLALEDWVEVSQKVPDLTVEPALLIRIAQSLAELDHGEEAAIALRRALLACGPEPNPALLVKIARLAARVDPRLARGAARVALSRPELDPGMRVETEQLLDELSRTAAGTPLAVG